VDITISHGTGLQNDVAVLQNDVAVLQNDVTVLQNDVAVLQNDVVGALIGTQKLGTSLFVSY
jgi:hypothetical protein